MKARWIVLIVVIGALVVGGVILAGCGGVSVDDFAVRQTVAGEPFQIIMIGQEIMPIMTNPCEQFAPMDLDPNNTLGGMWDVFYIKLPDPHGDVVVLYFQGKPIKMVPLVKSDGSHYQCP